MGSPLSEDLRVRVIRAVEDGLSRRQAAERFGVGVSSAIRWVADWRGSGRTAALPQGGDQRSSRIEAEADFLMARCEQQLDITLAELQELLLRERGVAVGIGTLWRFFDRRGISFKKNRARRRAGSA
jgi:transposase